jgi:hypothetical protein
VHRRPFPRPEKEISYFALCFFMAGFEAIMGLRHSGFPARELRRSCPREPLSVVVGFPV